MVGRLQDKVAIVTGGGRGIGEATARAMAAQGAKVVVAELDVATGERTAAEIGGLLVPCDVREPTQLVEVAARTLAAHGRIDVLVANAGINVFHEPLETTEEEWRRCFAVDLDGVWHSCRAVLPTMLAQGGGSIVAIASCHSFAIIPHTFPYPVAKHGLLGLVRALGIEYAAKGVRVNAIAPGYIETQIALDYWSTFPDPQAERQKACDLHPPKRVGRPEEVAMTAVFLASDEAPFINAACITIDGGRSVLYHD
jgi:NAD(P)-dependent dehydrogenase (short-subunit alcohol dehydrogenase family)